MVERGFTLRGEASEGVITQTLYSKDCRTNDHPELGHLAYFVHLFRALLAQDSIFLLGTVAVGWLEDGDGNLPMIPPGVEVVETQIETYEGLSYRWQTQPFRRLAIRGTGAWIPVEDLEQILIETSICVLSGYRGPWPIDDLLSDRDEHAPWEVTKRLAHHCDAIILPDSDAWQLVIYSQTKES
jgi:hypothetical protein